MTDECPMSVEGKETPETVDMRELDANGDEILSYTTITVPRRNPSLYAVSDRVYDPNTGALVSYKWGGMTISFA